jgi:ribosomal protein S18 acetylase RimI-like enzyme
MAQLAAIYASTRREEVARTGWPAEMQERFLSQQFDAQHRDYRRNYPDAEWLVIERGGVALGRLYLEEAADTLNLIDIALLPEARGSGIGTAMLQDLADEAARNGKSLGIYVERNNPAMRLYLRLGFEKIAEHGLYDQLKWTPPA